jgi:maltose-binding protein MalE
MPYVARYDEMDEAIRTGLDAAYNGEKSAREAMAEVVRRVNDLLAGPA